MSLDSLSSSKISSTYHLPPLRQHDFFYVWTFRGFWHAYRIYVVVYAARYDSRGHNAESVQSIVIAWSIYDRCSVFRREAIDYVFDNSPETGPTLSARNIILNASIFTVSNVHLLGPSNEVKNTLLTTEWEWFKHEIVVFGGRPKIECLM